MKKLTSLLLAILMLIGVMAIPVSAADEVSVYLFGEKLEFDVPPQIINGRTMVPMRKIFESLDATVDWDGTTRTVTSVREGKTIILTIDSYTMYVNGEPITLDVAPCIVDSRTLVPARAVSESFDLKVDWDENTRSVLITNPIESDNALDKEILTTIGDYQISRAYYNCYYYTMYSQYEQYGIYYGEDWINMDSGYGMTIGEMIEEETKSQIETVVTAAMIAKKNYGITLDDVREEVSADMTETAESYFTDMEYKTFLAEINTTEEGLETYFGMYAILELLLKKTSEDGKVVSVSDAQAEELFNMEYADKVKVQHILISTQSLDGYTPAKSDTEAATIAYDVTKRLANGEDFGKLIEEFNEDPGQTADSYYVFGDGEMVPEFETASKNLAVGKYTTQAVKSAYGYHIIKRYPLDKTSEEYQNCKMRLATNSLAILIEDEVAKTEIKWNN